MGLSPYAKVKFADGNSEEEEESEAVLNTLSIPEESVAAIEAIPNGENTDEDGNGIMIVSIFVIITVVVCSIVVVVLRRKAK